MSSCNYGALTAFGSTGAWNKTNPALNLLTYLNKFFMANYSFLAHATY